MLINDKMVFLHLQKTGGSHLRSLLHELLPGTTQIGAHYRINNDFNIGNKLVIGAVRDPWNWYLSYWSFSCRKLGGMYTRSCRNKSIKHAFNNDRLQNSNGDLEFSIKQLPSLISAELTRPVKKWQYLYEDVNDVQRFRQWLILVMSSERKFDLFQDYGLSNIANSFGLYSYLYLFLYLKDIQILFNSNKNKQLTIGSFNNALIVDHWLKTESLNDDFFNALKTLDVTLTDEQKFTYLQKPKSNVSKRTLTKHDYYDQKSIELVRKKDGLIINNHGYHW